ncbi:MAG: mechanosensitive ion channel family protein [Bacteroidetes bacterium]|nr:mechanosensitive ion channel family protein [Bacteroidota bacterium]
MSKSVSFLRTSTLFIFGLVLLFAKSHAQDSAAINTTPYQVIYNHLFYLQPETYDPERSALSFPGDNQAENVELAIQLKQILDGKGLYVDINQVPDRSTLADTTIYTYVLFESDPKIYVEKGVDGWYYSRTTLQSIPSLHKDVYPLGANMMKYFTGPKWDKGFLKIKSWQWLGLLVILIISFIEFRILKLIIRFIIPRLSRIKYISSQTEIDTVGKAARTLSLFLVARTLIILLPILLLHPKVSFYLIRTLHIFSAVFMVLFLIHVVDLVMIYMTRMAERTANTMDDQVVPVVRRIIKGAVIVGGLIYILNLVQVNVTALLAGISIGGLALALAAQDTAKNLIGSLVIFVDRPFQIGDWISFDGVNGTVEEVGIRSTRLRTFENSLTSVPNGKLSDMTVNNMGVRLFRRFKTEVGITYDTPPHLIDAFVEGIRQMIIEHPYSRKDTFEVHLNSFGSNSLNILIYMFFKVPGWTQELTGKHDLIIGIINLADKLGIRFAFPTSTIHIEEMPGQTSLTPISIKDKDEAERRLNEHLEAYREKMIKSGYLEGRDAGEVL